MDSAEQERPGGSVPNAYGNAVAWRWTREMPATVRRSGLPTLLYALRAMANAAGELRFGSDRKPIRIQDIAKAACCDEKDARRYLEAGVRAGVVAVQGERRRGRPTLYVLVLSPSPDWSAAASYLDATKRDRSPRKPAPWAGSEDEKFGGRPPELDDAKFGGPPPELTGGTDSKVRGTAPRWSSGDRPPNGSGDRPPNNPGRDKELPQEVAEVSSQPQVDGPAALHIGHQEQPRADPADFVRCAHCHQPMLPRPGRTTHAHCKTTGDAI